MSRNLIIISVLAVKMRYCLSALKLQKYTLKVFKFWEGELHKLRNVDLVGSILG